MSVVVGLWVPGGVKLGNGCLVAARADNVVNRHEFLHVGTTEGRVKVSLFVALHLERFKHLRREGGREVEGGGGRGRYIGR